MCTTIGGNTVLPFSGSDSVRPEVTAVRACITVASTTRLPADRAVMRSPSRMGTPDEMSVPSVLYAGVVLGRTVFPTNVFYEAPGETTALELLSMFLNAGTFM